jgi:hypothetical protein
MALVVAGSGSEFLWNLPGAPRSLMLLHEQEHARPAYRKGERFEVEFPRHWPKRAWANRQGVFLLRSFQTRDIPYPGLWRPIWSCPAVHGFVPLAADGSHLELDRVEWFPLAKYALQLDGGGDLHCRGGTPHWCNDGYRRRLALSPDCPAGKPGAVVCTIDLSAALGRRRLSFDYLVPSAPGAAVPQGHRPGLQVVALVQGSRPQEKVLAQHELTPGAAPARLDLDVSDSGIAAIEIRFTNLSPGVSACLDELNLQADDFRR